ncbi:hypothetical protein OJ998_24230 [Solirubrobacter taibaiensis]|nr:hypothetical protein [Solirubrobacter taibaiensis]
MSLAAAEVIDRRDGDAYKRRVRVYRRSPQGAWSRPVVVVPAKTSIERATCGIDDAGRREDWTLRVRPLEAS